MAITKTATKRLKEIYQKQIVTVYMKNMHIVTTDANGEAISGNLVLDGQYVIDVDQDFLYLGDPDGNVFKTLQHTDYGLIELTDIVDLVMGDLDVYDEGDVH